MVVSCCVTGCTNRLVKNCAVPFFRVPSKDPERFHTWVKAINRSDDSGNYWKPTKYHRVCGEHFITGRINHDPFHPDYVPNQKMDLQKQKKPKTTLRRYQNAKRRESIKTEQEKAESAAVALMGLSVKQEPELTHTDEGTQTQEDHALQIAIFKAKVRHLEAETDFILQEKQRLEKTLANELKLKFTFENVCHEVKFLTGISLHLFNILRSKFLELPHTALSLSVEDSLLLTLMRLRMACTKKDLSIRFRISPKTVHKIFTGMVDSLHDITAPLIIWPEQSVCWANMPASFLPHFKHVISIIDCFEVFVEKPKNPTARAKSWSNCKHWHTIKFLISVTPSGATSFISEGRGGRVSHRQITLDSGYLQKLVSGDEVLAGSRRFSIQTECAARGAKLHLPAATEGKRLFLTGVEVRRSRHNARVRLRVEKVVERLQAFRILTSTLPLQLDPYLDKIVVIVAGLVNVQKSFATI